MGPGPPMTKADMAPFRVRLSRYINVLRFRGQMRRRDFTNCWRCSSNIRSSHEARQTRTDEFNGRWRRYRPDRPKSATTICHWNVTSDTLKSATRLRSLCGAERFKRELIELAIDLIVAGGEAAIRPPNGRRPNADRHGPAPDPVGGLVLICSSGW